MARDPFAWTDAEPEDESARGLFAQRRSQGRTSVSCPPPELIEAARMGALPPHVQDRVAAHVEHCVVCQALGDALNDPSIGELRPDEQERILERVHAGAKASTRAQRVNRLWQFAAAAAAVVLLVAGTVLVWQSRRAAPAPSPPQVAAKVPRPAAPSVFQLQKPAFRQPAAGDLLWRGSGKGKATDDLTRAFDALRKNDFEDAARRLQTLVGRQPRSATPQFYLGVTELFLHRDHDAVTALQSAERLAQDDAELGREATWYLALAYYRTGQIEQAKDRLEVLCRGQGRRVAQACAGIRELSGPITLSGVVTGPGGVPLAGVRVAELKVDMGPDRIIAYPTEVSVTTDAAGHYSITGASTQVLEIYKPGYFSTGKVISTITQDTQIDLSMDPWEFISLGEVVRRTIKPGDTTCGDPNELCHRFALRVPSDGTLDVVLDSPSPGTFRPLPYQADALRNWDLHLETPQGDAYGPPLGTSFPMRLAIPVERGATYQIRVLSYADRAREYELRTALR
jgi:hypothetical protein